MSSRPVPLRPAKANQVDQSSENSISQDTSTNLAAVQEGNGVSEGQRNNNEAKQASK